MITRAKLRIASLSLGFFFAAASWIHGASQLESLTVGYASFSGHYTPMWIAVEDGLGKKYGIDLKAVYAGRMRPQQLLVSGDVPIVIATGGGALTSHILGAKDQVIVANFINKVGGAIYAKPEIKTAEDLRGKTIGVGRPGSITEKDPAPQSRNQRRKGDFTAEALSSQSSEYILIKNSLLRALRGHEKKFKNHQNCKFGLNEIKYLQLLIFAKRDFFSRPAPPR